MCESYKSLLELCNTSTFRNIQFCKAAFRFSQIHFNGITHLTTIIPFINKKGKVVSMKNIIEFIQFFPVFASAGPT